jgi:hypothetical protein
MAAVYRSKNALTKSIPFFKHVSKFQKQKCGTSKSLPCINRESGWISLHQESLLIFSLSTICRFQIHENLIVQYGFPPHNELTGLADKGVQLKHVIPASKFSSTPVWFADAKTFLHESRYIQGIARLLLFFLLIKRILQPLLQTLSIFVVIAWPRIGRFVRAHGFRDPVDLFFHKQQMFHQSEAIQGSRTAILAARMLLSAWFRPKSRWTANCLGDVAQPGSHGLVPAFGKGEMFVQAIVNGPYALLECP